MRSRLKQEDKARLKVLFIAKHAMSDGSRDEEDGDHAVYHCHVRDTLRGLGLDLEIANSAAALHDKPRVDFVFSLLNRAGYFNSEMAIPLLCEQHRLAYLGASPIQRGLADDKHLMKRAARSLGVKTADWVVIRRHQPLELPAGFPQSDLIVKPNASSASWGIRHVHSVEELWDAVRYLHDQGHDAIIEPFMEGIDIELPVIAGPQPQFLPLMRFDHDPQAIRYYEEKRGLAESAAKLVQELDQDVIDRAQEMSAPLVAELFPFDYGRFEMRYNEATGEISFLEVNIQCNIWEPRVLGSSARLAGLSYPDLLETIIAHSMLRQGVVDAIETEETEPLEIAAV